MDHPAVAQVVTFAMPHDKLGEDVAAAVVLREGHDGHRGRDPRLLLATRLADFKVPRTRRSSSTRFPKGATGKLQRIGLAAEARPRLMRIAVFGAGAIGGYLAAKLAAAGRVDLSVVARGAHLAGDANDGLRLIEDGTETARTRCAASRRRRRPRRAGLCRPGAEGAFGPAGARPDRAADRPGHRRRHHAERRAVVVFLRLGGPLEGTRIEAVDPGGVDLERRRARSGSSAPSSIRRPRSTRRASSGMSTDALLARRAVRRKERTRRRGLPRR